MTFISVYLCMKAPKWRDKPVGLAGLGRSDNIRDATACLSRSIGR